MLRAGRLGPDALAAGRARVPGRRPRPLPPQRRAARRPQRHPRHRSSTSTNGDAHAAHRPGRAPLARRSLRGRAPRARLRPDRPRRPGSDRRPRLRPRSTTRARSRSGATSPAPAPARETRLYLAGEALEREAHGREPVAPRAAGAPRAGATTSASEPLALEQASGTSDATAHLLAARQRQLEQARTRAAQRLARPKPNSTGSAGAHRRGRSPISTGSLCT